MMQLNIVYIIKLNKFKGNKYYLLYIYYLSFNAFIDAFNDIFPSEKSEEIFSPIRINITF